MAYYSDGRSDARLVLRAIRHTFDFTGRSRRAELLLFYIATALLGVFIGFPLSMIMPAKMASYALLPLYLMVTAPTFALFVRRVHDHGQSGWWVILPVVTWTMDLYNSNSRWHRASWPQRTELPWWLSLPLMLLLLVLVFRAGTAGPNLYGEDPRQTG